MRREISQLRLTELVALGATTALMLCVVCGDAVAGVSRFGGQVSGPGMATPGKPVSLGFSLRAYQPADVPPLRRIKSVALQAPGVSFHPRAKGIRMCGSVNARRCPRMSRVGGGAISGYLATPGGTRTEFGSLSTFKGRLSFYNLRPRGGQTARFLLRLETARPIRGLVMRTVATVNSHRILVVKVPRLKDLPEWIRRSYPRDARVILDRFSARVSSSRRRGVDPFLTVNRPGVIGFSVVASE